MSDKKKLLFIINPFAGYRSKNRMPKLINEVISKEMFDYDIEETQYAGHASEIAAEGVTSQYNAVVAIGGDGTLNEVASSLIYTDVALGIVPGGSGNGMSTHLGIGRSARKALRILGDYNVRRMDSVKLNDRFYLNMAGIGIDGLVAYKTKLNAKRGFSNYLKGALVESIKYKNQKYTIEVDGKEYTGKFLSVNVANGSMFGYNFTIAADADTSDGLLDTLMIRDAHKIDYFGNAWRFWAGRIHKSKLAKTAKTSSLKLTTYEDSYMHIDGEGYPCPPGEFEFTVMKDSLNVIC
ncbi:MAG: diacylglycerol kinase (ATP) [Saprospiraceae bacterium]|jgi:diacylglycerol kinase (ATP)